MHSSRMRTARSSSHPGEVCLHQAPPQSRPPRSRPPQEQAPHWRPAARHAGIAPAMHAGIAPPWRPAARHAGIPPTMHAGIAPPREQNHTHV